MLIFLGNYLKKNSLKWKTFNNAHVALISQKMNKPFYVEMQKLVKLPHIVNQKPQIKLTQLLYCSTQNLLLLLIIMHRKLEMLNSSKNNN